MDEELELAASLSSTGWFVVETIERMMEHSFTPEEIMLALDLPSEDHLAYLLQRGHEERMELENDLHGLSD